MPRTKKPAIRQWGNKLGWDVPVEHGMAEVIDCVTWLRVWADIEPSKEYSERLGRELTIERCKGCNVPIGTDPVVAVALCLRHGVVQERGVYSYRPEEIPMVHPEINGPPA